ncbi:NAD-binding protein [Actinophytocola xanthii]|uniref:NAD-binding protein n=1 Tax=Actinophytocola xanthii TaxID=1912961 RepID=UPI002FCE1401
MLAAGPEELRERVAPVFAAVGSRTLWVSERPGDGHRLKLTANAWILSITAAAAQSVALADRLGLDPRLFLKAIAGAPADSAYAQLKGRNMIEGVFEPAFALGGAVKDAELILDTVRGAGLDERLIRAVHDQFRSAARAGHAEEDMAAVIRATRGEGSRTARSGLP